MKISKRVLVYFVPYDEVNPLQHWRGFFYFKKGKRIMHIPPLKRPPTEDEMKIILTFIELQSIYITDDYSVEFEEENPIEIKAYDDLMAKLY